MNIELWMKQLLKKDTSIISNSKKYNFFLVMSSMCICILLITHTLMALGESCEIQPVCKGADIYRISWKLHIWKNSSWVFFCSIFTLLISVHCSGWLSRFSSVRGYQTLFLSQSLKGFSSNTFRHKHVHFWSRVAKLRQKE